MLSDIESTAEALRALSNPKRLTIVHWLADPTSHFPPQRDGDLVADGVCVGFITKKIKLSQPAVTEHMQVLAAANLVTSKKIARIWRPITSKRLIWLSAISIHLKRRFQRRG